MLKNDWSQHIYKRDKILKSLNRWKKLFSWVEYFQQTQSTIVCSDETVVPRAKASAGFGSCKDILFLQKDIEAMKKKLECWMTLYSPSFYVCPTPE